MKPFLLASFYFFFYTVSAQTNQPSLNAAAITQKMYYGSILDHYDLGNRQYVSYVSHHAGVITTENAMKWENVEWNEGNFTLTNGANVVSWANENGKKMRGHCLVWHVNLPSWVQSISDKARLQAVLETHIDTVVTFHKGKIWHWDVVNEVFNDDGTLRKTVFYNVTGEDYLSTAFHAARKADPDAKLFVNEYAIDFPSLKLNGLVSYVKKWIDAGVPIDGIATQAHVDAGQVLPASYAKSLAALASTGVSLIYISEVDVKIRKPVTWSKLKAQQVSYRIIVEACVMEPKCVGVSTWGLTDKYSWISHHPGIMEDYDAALPLDREFAIKPAFNGILEGFAVEPVALSEPTETSMTEIAKKIPENALMIYGEDGLSAGWESWGWNESREAKSTGPPAPILGRYVYKTLINVQGGVSFKGIPLGNEGYLVFYIALNVRPDSVRVRLEATNEPIDTVFFATPAYSLVDLCGTDMSTGSFSRCQLQIPPDHDWDRITMPIVTTSTVILILGGMWVEPPKSNRTTTQKRTTTHLTSTTSVATETSGTPSGANGQMAKTVRSLPYFLGIGIVSVLLL